MSADDYAVLGDVCDTCNGRGEVPCEGILCDEDCSECEGDGFVDCPDCRGVGRG